MKTQTNFFVSLVASLVLLLGGNAAHANVAGHVQFVNGEVRLTTAVGKTHSVQKGDAVNEGDTLTSAKAASAQIKMQDGGLVAMRPDTQLKFDSFKFSGKEDGSEQSFFSLFKGGFRAVTGLIGQLNKRNYRITTPAATIGIRGTDHETFVVAPGSELAAVAPVGAYNKVNLGETYMATDKGTIFVLPNQMGFAGAADQMPQLQPINTNIFTVAAGPTPQAKGDKQEGKEEGVRETAVVDNTAQEQVAAPAPTTAAPENTVTTNFIQIPITTDTGQVLSGAPLTLNIAGGDGVKFTDTTGLDGIETGIAPHAAGTPPSLTELMQIGSGYTYIFDAVGLTQWYSSAPFTSPFIARGTAQSLDTGWDGGVIHWGRWGNGITAAGGWADGLNFGPDQGWHFIVGIPTPLLQIPVTGTFTYNLIGGTSPTPSDGVGGGLGLGSLISGSATANFTSATINGNLVMGFNGASIYQATYNGPMGDGLNLAGTTTFQSGSINVCGAGCSTQYQGLFFGANASHLGVGYMITTNQNFNINGVAAYKR